MLRVIKYLLLPLFCALFSFPVCADQEETPEKTLVPWNKKLIANIPGLLKTKSYEIKKVSYLKYIRAFKDKEFGGNLRCPIAAEYALPDNSSLCILAQKGVEPTLVTIDVRCSKFEYKTHLEVLTAAGLFKAGYKLTKEIRLSREDRDGVKLEHPTKAFDSIFVLFPNDDTATVYAFFSEKEYMKMLSDYVNDDY